MKQENLMINHIPAILWGNLSEHLIIAIHGNQSFKADIPIMILAEIAEEKGYQVLSFDLPEHGDRIDEDIPCKVQIVVEELKEVMEYVRKKWSKVSLFGNSIGAYFSLVSYPKEEIEQVWFLSPVLNMQRIIENMMKWFSIDEESLKKEEIISTPIGQKLYWDYYCYVKEHPIKEWNFPTHILYGEKDELCELDTIIDFVEKYHCKLEVVSESEHYFHTENQLKKLKEWLKEEIPQITKKDE